MTIIKNGPADRTSDVSTNIKNLASQSFVLTTKLSFSELQKIWDENINGEHDLRIQYREEFCENNQYRTEFNDLKKDDRMHDPIKYIQDIDFPFAEEEWVALGKPVPNLSCISEEEIKLKHIA